MTDEEHIAELEAQLAARTRRLEDTDAALVACERSRDQAKDALAERTQALEDACQELADATGSEFTWREQLETAEAALAERTRELERADYAFNQLHARLRAVEQDIAAYVEAKVDVDRQRLDEGDAYARTARLMRLISAEQRLKNYYPAPTPHGG